MQEVLSPSASQSICSPRSFSIGPVKVDPLLILAPMSGVTNSCFRRLIKTLNPGAVGLVVTEFISIEGMTRKNLQSVRMMQFKESERPLSIQIFGYDVDRMVEAAKMVQDSGADIIDINSGCPVPKVVKKGGGCELMRQPEHLQKILTEVRKAVSIPLTLKIRSGWDPKNRNALDVARRAEDAGVDMLAVHGRSRQEMYRGLADWDIVREVAAAIKIPVVGSGDVISPESARKSLASGVKGLMIGRAALFHPWVFSEILSSLDGEVSASTPRPANDVARVLALFRDMLLEEMPEKAALGRLKQLSSQVTRRVYGSAEYRKRLCSSKDLQEFSQQLLAFEERFRSCFLCETQRSESDDDGSEESSSVLSSLGDSSHHAGSSF